MRLVPITLTGWRLVRRMRYAPPAKADWLHDSLRLFPFGLSAAPERAGSHPLMPDDHSKLVPLLPIPNRTVKRLCADDSAGSRVKVGHRQALTARIPPLSLWSGGVCLMGL